jgi:hypothetical protein
VNDLILGCWFGLIAVHTAAVIICIAHHISRAILVEFDDASIVGILSNSIFSSVRIQPITVSWMSMSIAGTATTYVIVGKRFLDKSVRMVVCCVG